MKAHANNGQDTKNKQKIIGWTLLMLFSILLLSIVPFFRFLNNDGWPTGDETYYHMKMGEDLLDNIISERSLNSLNLFDPFHIVIGLSGKIVGIKNTALFLPLIFGLITIALIFNILSIIFQSPKQRLLAAIFIATSPIFLTTFSQMITITWISLIMSSGIYFFIRHDKYQWLAFIILPLLYFYNILHIIITILVIIFIGHKLNKKNQSTILCGILSILLLISLISKDILFHIRLLNILEIIEIMFADVGGQLGFSLFGIILAIVGIQYLWREKKIKIFSASMFIFLTIITIFSSQVYAIYLNIFISITAAIGFLKLTKREWRIISLRNITLFLLILGVVYSGTAIVAKNATAMPDSETMYALTWLEQKSEPDSIILSQQIYSNIIQEATKRRVITNDKKLPKISNDIEKLYQTRRIDVAVSLIEKYDIDYIVIFEEMKRGLVWNKEDQGLLFLLESRENFKKVFENNKVTVWEIKKGREK